MPFLSLRSTPVPFSLTLNAGKQIKQYNKSMNLSPTVQYPKKLTEQKDSYFSSIFSFTFTMKANKSIHKAKVI
jgi:hypothetical protein